MEGPSNIESAFKSANIEQIVNIIKINPDCLNPSTLKKAIENGKKLIDTLIHYIQQMHNEKVKCMKLLTAALTQKRNDIAQLKNNLDSFSSFKKAQYEQFLKESNIWRVKIVELQENIEEIAKKIAQLDETIHKSEEDHKKFKIECETIINRLYNRNIEQFCKSVSKDSDQEDVNIARAYALILRSNDSIETAKSLFSMPNVLVSELVRSDPRQTVLQNAEKALANITNMFTYVTNYNDKQSCKYMLMQWILSFCNLVVGLKSLESVKKSRMEVHAMIGNTAKRLRLTISCPSSTQRPTSLERPLMTIQLSK